MNTRMLNAAVILAAAIGLAAHAPAALANPKDTYVFNNKVSQKTFNDRCNSMGGGLSTGTGSDGGHTSTCDLGGGKSATCVWDSAGSVCVGSHGGSGGGGGRPQ